MRAAIAGAVVLAVILPGAAAKAAEPSTGVVLGSLVAPRETVPQVPPRADGGRLDSRLSAVAAAANRGAGATRAEAVGLTLDHGSVRVVVHGDPGRVAQALEAAGATGLAQSPQGYEASITPRKLSAVAAAPGVRSISAAPRPFALSVSGEEVAAIHAQAWHSAGITGAGSKVAIIDVGFVGLAAAQTAGDVPVSVTTADFCSGGFSTGTSHGTAVTEIVHEIAPDAQLLLACVDSASQLAAAETWAIAQGAKIINHSVGWFNTARGDGQGESARPTASSPTRQRTGSWVNAAGNSAQQHWSGAFSDVNGDGYRILPRTTKASRCSFQRARSSAPSCAGTSGVVSVPPITTSMSSTVPSTRLLRGRKTTSPRAYPRQRPRVIRRLSQDSLRRNPPL